MEHSLHPPGTPGDSSKERASQSLRDKRGLHPCLLPAVGRDPDPTPCLYSEEPPLDLTGKVYQLEVMLKQLHTDLQKVRPPGSCLTWHFSGAWGWAGGQQGWGSHLHPHPVCSRRGHPALNVVMSEELDSREGW